MRYAEDHKDQSRAQILEAIGRGFREQGYGAGVDGLAKSAGLTSGALYGHFQSKAKAFQFVVEAGLQRLWNKISGFQSDKDRPWVDGFTEFYLGEAHRGDVAGGCILPSLSVDVSRLPENVKSTYQAELLRVADLIDANLEGNAEETRRKAWSLLALLAGGVIMSRAVHDDAVAAEISAAIRKSAQELGINTGAKKF